MELLEAADLFFGRDYGIFHGAADDRGSGGAFVMIIFIIVRKLVFGDPVSGWPSLVCIILFLSGVQFFCTGILGQYLAKTYMEVKRRPIYLIREEI